MKLTSFAQLLGFRWWFRRRYREDLDGVLDEVVQCLKVRDPVERVMSLSQLDSVLFARAASGSDEARVAHAAVIDLVLDDLRSQQRRARRGSDSHESLESIIEINRDERDKIATSAEFEQRVGELKDSLRARVRAAN